MEIVNNRVNIEILDTLKTLVYWFDRAIPDKGRLRTNTMK